MRSPQTLSETDRRLVAAWAADCAEHVLRIFQSAAPGDARPRELIARARAFARGELGVAEQIRRRFDGGVPAHTVPTPAAGAAARAAGQAAATAHMGAHALGAAAYAAKAAGLAAPDRADAVTTEVRWQVDQMSPAVRAALGQLPRVGENRAGPLGPGLLATGLLGEIIGGLQASVTDFGDEFTPPAAVDDRSARIS
jgi:hypothetical protein